MCWKCLQTFALKKVYCWKYDFTREDVKIYVFYFSFFLSRILRNGIKVDSSYTTSGRDSSNTYSFLAATEDNNAKFRCESKNELSTEPLTAEIVLSVQCKYHTHFIRPLSWIESALNHYLLVGYKLNCEVNFEVNLRMN